MRHITIAIENMETNKHVPKDEEHISIIERIVQKTGNPKIAAVLALDLFLVGVDTVKETCLKYKMKIHLKKYIFFQTSVAVASTIYQISKNPEKQQQLFEELRTIMPSKTSVIDTSVLEKMPYLRACIKETLR